VNIRPKKHVLLPMMAVSLSLATAGLALAQQRHDPRPDEAPVSLQINLGTRLHWAGVQGTRVEYVPLAERPAYDVFRYGGAYYVYNSNSWYMSRRERGEFKLIDDRLVPGEFLRVPRENWRNYPSTWDDRHDRRSDGPSAFLQVQFNARPHWLSVRGTRVRVLRRGEGPGYDMFRYGSNYYVYNDSSWYMSSRSRGRFAAIDDRLVPREFSRVPREHWRNYPSTWSDRDHNSHSDGRGDHDSRDRSDGDKDHHDKN
jgi:hypothetical protein